MTKQELFEHMEADESQFYEYFTKIPESLRTSDVAERWIEHCHENIAGAAANDFFSEIVYVKPEIITDRIRMLAVGLSPATLTQIKPEDTSAYKEIALLAISKSILGIHLLDKAFRTPDMLQAIFERSPERIDLWPKSHHWMRPLITPAMKESLLETNLKFALCLDEKEVTRDQWRKLFSECPGDFSNIENRGRLHVLVDFVREGGWLAPRDGCSWERGETIDDALRAFSDIDGKEPGHTLYKANLHTFPIEDVMAATNHRSQIPVLTKIYPDAVLRKNMKHNRALRAHLLENDLGM